MGPFGRRRVAVAPQHGHVQEHIGKVALEHDESVALRNVEPFDTAADFDEIEGGFIAVFVTAFEIEISRYRISAAHLPRPHRHRNASPAMPRWRARTRRIATPS